MLSSSSSLSSTTKTSEPVVMDDIPTSIEEAGAMLGAAINCYGAAQSTVITPPKGTHSSFSVLSPIPSSTLLVRLHSLRALMRNAPTNEPLVAAPSILALLMKLLGASTTLAAAATSATTITALTASSITQNVLVGKAGNNSSNGPLIKRVEPPPMWSTPLRKLWVDCVVLCHTLGDGLSGTSRINLFGFVRNMVALANTNPRSARAGGGTRIAAMDVLAGLLQVPKLSSQLSSWALDMIQLIQRALKSSGNGEPTYRISSVRAACMVAVACRQSVLKLKPTEGSVQLVIKGALEDKAIVEVVRLLKQGTMDKYPEVRQATATLAGLLAPMLILSPSPNSSRSDGREPSPTTSLEDVMTIAFKNLDDESPDVAAGWADAFARCMSTAIEYCKQVAAESGGRRSADADATSGGDTGAKISSTRKGTVLVSNCNTLRTAVKYLVGLFVKVGGELVAPRAGGPFSTGGRAVRLGVSRTLVQLLRFQSQLGAIGESRDLSTKEATMIVLTMVGNDMDSQLNAPEKKTAGVQGLDATSVILQASAARDTATNQLFGKMPKKSHADAGIARVCANRVLREGINELGTESAQISTLHEMVALCKNNHTKLRGNQLQVLLIEISHLITALGEAVASAVEETLAALKPCIIHADHGVRHEAAVVCAALNSLFPNEGRKLVQNSLNDIQLEHAELMALASTRKVETTLDVVTPRLLARFGRGAPAKEKKVDESLKHQYAIHGLALMISMIIRDLPSLPGGLPTDLFGDVLSVSEILVSSLFNDIMTNGNASAACTSVRAGFAIISGGMTAGPDAIAQHFSLIFSLWQKTSKPATRGKVFTPAHELICVDAMLASMVAFLKYCSELLLSVPDALSRICMLLEEILAAFFPNGRLGSTPKNPVVASRLQSAKASILEAFAWLPPGSYPMIADSVFSFAAHQIKAASEGDVSCSILRSLVNKEDHLLDAESLCRAVKVGQVGGARDLEQDILTLRAEIAHHGDRESVMHLISQGSSKSQADVRFRGSRILGLYAYDDDEVKPPTPLHQVGTWQMPVNPSSCSKVRLVDAAVQAFSAAFCLKSGKEQQAAVQMLEELVPPMFPQGARGMAVPTEQDKKAELREENAAVVNIVAVLLSCLKTIPLHEATHNVPVGLGPLWMNKAKDLLVQLLPSPSHIIRRAAAEGLALLATLGVTEDSHFLQSSVLHSLDELMQGNKTEGKPRGIAALEQPASAARAGALMTLACIQRTAHILKEKRSRRDHGRGGETVTSKEDSNTKQTDEQVPTIQMMTRILPSIACQGVRDFFGVRTYALHSFGIIFTYSKRFQQATLDPVDEHFLKKSIELVEDNFAAAWTAAAADYDKGNEGDKLSSEASFLAVLLRLMTQLVPSLHHLNEASSAVLLRFSCMASLILDYQDGHPTVLTEALALFEVIADHQHLLPQISTSVQYQENPLLCSIPHLVSISTPDRAQIHTPVRFGESLVGCLSSTMCVRAALRVTDALFSTGINVATMSDMQIVGQLFAKLEDMAGSKQFKGELVHRSLAEPRNFEISLNSQDDAERELCSTLSNLVGIFGQLEEKTSKGVLVRWMLLTKNLLSASSEDGVDDSEEISYTVPRVIGHAVSVSIDDSSPVAEVATSVRWQVKCLAIQVMRNALKELTTVSNLESPDAVNSDVFNPKIAQVVSQNECRDAQATNSALPASHLSLHFSDVLIAACANCIATVDQAELQMLQENSLHLLMDIIRAFGRIPDPAQPESKLLEDAIPQLSSCIKSALNAWKEHKTAMSYRLFIVGCEALEAFIEADVTSEKPTLKRIARGAFLEAGETQFFAPTEEVVVSANADESAHQDSQAILLMRLGKLWTAGMIAERSKELLPEFKATKAEMGAHSAALALDGVCLLTASDLSLCGVSMNIKREKLECTGGYLYDDIITLNHYTKAELAKKWAPSARNAMIFLSEAVDVDVEEQEVCKEWIRKVVPCLFAGFHSTMSVISGQEFSTANELWARAIRPNATAVACLEGLCFLARFPSLVELDESWAGELELLVKKLSSSVIEPILSAKIADSSNISEELVSVSYEMIRQLSNTASTSTTEGSALLVSILMPLDRLQQKLLILNSKSVCGMVAAALEATSTLIENAAGPSTLVKAVLPIAVNVLSRQYNEHSLSEKLFAPVQAAAHVLLKTCLQNDGVGVASKRNICTQMARAEVWTAWKLLATSNDCVVIIPSVEIIRGYMLSLSEYDRQLSCLHAVREVVQALPVPGPIVERLVLSLSAEIFAIMRSYATLHTSGNDPIAAAAVPIDVTKARRTEVCADCMKLILTTLQQLSAPTPDNDGEPNAEKKLIAYLSVLFETFVIIIRFNGLPNHPIPQPQRSDPALGRMCAQALLHIARTCPSAFKACMGGVTVMNPETGTEQPAIADQDRAVLEFAVRAEMSGYASATAAPAAPVKKKLSLKGFKK